MSSRYQFILNGTIVDDPKGWDDLEDNIKYDDQLHGWLYTQEATLEFIGSGYNLLKKLFHVHGVDFNVPIIVKESCGQNGTYTTEYEGLIFLADIEWDHHLCIAKTKLQDDSYYAWISGNKSIETSLLTGLSKNGTVIPAPPIYILRVLDPATGLEADSKLCWRIHDVLKFLLSFMTDDRVDFVSEMLDVGGEWEGLCISNGWYLIHIDDVLPLDAVAPRVSFSKVMDAVWKQTFFSWEIKKNKFGRPYLRLEKDAYMYNSKPSVTLDLVKDHKISIDQSKLYSAIRFGSEQTVYAPGKPFFEKVDFYSCKEEQLFIRSIANIDKELNLMSPFVVSPNILNEVLINNDQEYTEEIFLIECDTLESLSCYTKLTPSDFGTSYGMYNEKLMNFRVAERLLNGIPGDIIKYLGSAADLFRAEWDGDTASDVNFDWILDTISGGFAEFIAECSFNDDYTLPNFDANNHWGNGTTPGDPVPKADARFTAFKTGLFEFIIDIKLDPPTAFGRLEILADIYNSDTSPYDTVVFKREGDPSNTGEASSYQNSFFMEKDQYVMFRLFVKGPDADPDTPTILAGSYITYLGSDFISIQRKYDSASARVLKHQFTSYLSRAQFNSIKNNITMMIEAVQSQKTFDGWITSVNHKRKDGETKFILKNSIASAQ